MSTTFSTQPYKGTRDFYPEDLRKKRYIFETWRNTLVNLGFVEYETSLLENAELYIAKSGAELGGSQLYNFTDKGDRFVALRPEQTPSLARIIANKYRELRFPLRWFSIPNCFRYERPQKGRTREHWQLNVDIIGLEAGLVELELLLTLGRLFRAFSANKEHFSIQYNHRGLLDAWLGKHQLLEHQTLIYKVLDDWYKTTTEHKKQELTSSLSSEQIEIILQLGSQTGNSWQEYKDMSGNYPELIELATVPQQVLPDIEYALNPCIIRGIAYYTGIVFEAFDKNSENARALFGGGRYDNLMEMFGQQAPAIGFGWGDTTMDLFLTGHNLYPDFSEQHEVVGILLLQPESAMRMHTEIIPSLIRDNKAYDINYEFTRSESKRYESLKKRGCSEIIKV
jgi:histidyl-tRNA synthetase